MLASPADGEYFAQLILAFKNECIPLKESGDLVVFGKWEQQYINVLYLMLKPLRVYLYSLNTEKNHRKSLVDT